MSDKWTVSVVTPHARIAINYRTGRTELSSPRLQAARAQDGTVVPYGGSVSSWGTLEVPAVLVAPAPVASWWRLGAVLAVAVTAAVKMMSRRRSRFSRLVRLACVGRRLPRATDRQARNAVLAVRWVSPLMPARWACLEQATAAAVLLAVIGHRAEWRHGVATDPVRLHAWIADRAGEPVEEPDETSLYIPTFTPDGPGPSYRTRE